MKFITSLLKGFFLVDDAPQSVRVIAQIYSIFAGIFTILVVTALITNSNLSLLVSLLMAILFSIWSDTSYNKYLLLQQRQEQSCYNCEDNQETETGVK